MKNKYRIVAESNGNYIVTRELDENLDISSIKGFVVDKEGRVLTPELPIPNLTRDGNWRLFEANYEDFISDNQDYVRDALLGAAVGDAFGVPYEFLPRSAISKLEINDMIGKDTNPPFKSRWSEMIPSGSYSDDTSMIVATMDSMVRNQAIDYEHIMHNYLLWWEKGKYSSLPYPFGLGAIIGDSLERYQIGFNPTECGGKDFMDNGNGSLMRILPFSLYCINKDLTDEETLDVITKGSSLTHGHEISIMACFMYTIFLRELIRTRNKNLAFGKMIGFEYDKYFSKETVELYKRINDPNFRLKIDDIKESGYVVDTLETVMYAIMNSNNYRDTIENCVRIGYDTDTSACIAGSLAGVLYGANTIPKEWLDKLRKRDYLESLSMGFKNALENMVKDKQL